LTDICLVGEAWGVEEEKSRSPFVGAAGYLLNQLLDEAGIHRADCFITNVFNIHPPGNKLEWFCGAKADAIEGYPALVKGKHVRREFICELDRLGEELTTINPNLIIALGNTAMWALLGKTAISKFRGTTELSTHTAVGFKTLPTYHPSNLFHQFENRSVVVLDLMKAKRESEFPEIRRPKREIWIEPTLEDLDDFEQKYIKNCRTLSVDIETSGDQITCIGFSPNYSIALVIPFYDSRRKERSYWPNADNERRSWEFIKKILGNRDYRKLFQNGLYDIAFLWRAYGIKVMGAEEDTMLLHHALQPEALKGLGFLGSIYTDEGAWKHMRSKHETIKKDD
jgi:uracil-DNA glycosylase